MNNERMKYVIFRSKHDCFEVPVLKMWEDKKDSMIKYLDTEVNSGYETARVALMVGGSVIYSVFKRGNNYYLKTKDRKESVLKVANIL